MKQKIALVLAALLSLSLAACSSQASTNTGAQSASTAAETASTEAGAESAGFTTVTEGKLTMSTNAAFPPYEMTKDDGTFEGIDVEIAGVIAEKLGLELQIDDMDFDSALLAVQQGKSDIVMAGVTVNEERKLVMSFTDSYSTGVQVVIVKEGSDITSVDDLKECLIGTQRGTTGNIYCEDDFGADHVVTYDNGLTATKALLNDQIDCIVIDSGPANEFVKANEGLTILPTEYVTEDYAIGLALENEALKEAINAALKELIADGTVQAIVDKYITAE